MGLQSDESPRLELAIDFAWVAHFENPWVTMGIHSGVFPNPSVKYRCAAATSISPSLASTLTVLKTHSPIQFCGEGGPCWKPTCRFCTLVCRKSLKHCINIWSSTTFGWLQHDCGFFRRNGIERDFIHFNSNVATNQQEQTHYLITTWNGGGPLHCCAATKCAAWKN